MRLFGELGGNTVGSRALIRGALSDTSGICGVRAPLRRIVCFVEHIALNRTVAWIVLERTCWCSDASHTAMNAVQ